MKGWKAALVLGWISCAGWLMGQSGIVPVGAGSYTTVFPGTDVAGRNQFPGGQPQLSGNALGRPVPTNDWWSLVVKQDHAGNLFNYPLSMRTLPRGLDIGHVVPGSGPNGSVQPLSDQSPVVVGVVGLNAVRTTVADHSDWTVTLNWSSGAHQMWATSGVGMPMVYFEKSADSVARIEVNQGTATISGERLMIANSQSGANFVVFAPSGSVWQASGNVYTSTLNGKNFWTLGKMPTGQPIAQAAAALAAHAFAFPVDTRADWHYDEDSSLLRVDYSIVTEAKEGDETRIVQGLLPHQWAWLGSESAAPGAYTYWTVRGTLKLLTGNHFYTERHFSGILPTLPWIPGASEGFSIGALNRKISLMENESLSTWTDSYNEGQVLNRLIQTARVADLIGREDARDKMLATVRERVEDWFTAVPGERAFLFYYHAPWSALIGYPAGHGQDSNLNDHHFHWGYFIHAAAFIEQFTPGWAEQWGPMVHELIRDAGNPSRDDPKYPFLRNFSPYAGHSWANGFATFPQGNDQESTSESMQFNSALIHWGSVTGDTAIRDLGIYLYVTEQSAIEEYWFDIHRRNFRPEYAFALVSRVWGNGYDNGTFWTNDLAATYGIELYPIHGGSLYLGHHHAYAERLWNEMAANTGILSNQVNPNLWHDIYWKFLAFTDPALALQLYNSNPDRALKFGVSDVQTYHWLHAMYTLGRVEAGITADHANAAAFSTGGQVTYVAHNYSAEPLTVQFSDGARLVVPPRSMATNRDSTVRGVLRSDFAQTEVGGSVALELVVTAGNPDRVVFYLDDQPRQTLFQPPFTATIADLAPGVRAIHARLFADDGMSYSNVLNIQVGRQQAFDGQPWPIPGTLEAGKYDRFTGAIGQGITYHDNSPGNAGNFRPEEYVDAEISTTEGAYVGWTEAGEWLEYTVDVAQSGLYTLSLRFASGNNQQRGPIRLLVNGLDQTGPIALPATGGWNQFQTFTVEDVELIAGERVLRLDFQGGEVNIGRMTFTYSAPLSGDRPRADAGGTRIVLLPATQATLDGSNSYVPDDRTPTFEWSQRFGPTVVQFSDRFSINPTVSGLTEGFYGFRLILTDGVYEDQADLLLVVSAQEQVPPRVSFLTPAPGSAFGLGIPIALTASAADVDGSVQSVAFYQGDIRIGTAWNEPWTISWTPYAVGSYAIVAVAIDNDGMQGSTEPLTVEVTAPVPCGGLSPDGNYSYAFSRQGDDYYLTFIPVTPGVGQNLCLLYYSLTGAAPFPGYIVSPNVPFRINGTTGQTVTFYYTYSHPAGGERTTLGQPQVFTLAPCGTPPPVDGTRFLNDWRRVHFPQAMLADQSLEHTVWGDFADPDGDGYPNIMEAYLGMDPLRPDAPRNSFHTPVGQHTVWSVGLPIHLPEGLISVQTSANLIDWRPIEASDHSSTAQGHRLLHHFILPPGAADAFFRFVVP